MTVRPVTYTDRNGRRRRSRKYYVCFTDHMGRRRRIPGFTDRLATQRLAEKIERLVLARMSGEPPDRDLTEWLQHLPGDILKRLVKAGLVDQRRAAALKPLIEHVKDFERSLRDRGNTEQHVRLTVQRMSDVLEGCGFRYWQDIDASKVEEYLAWLRNGPRNLSMASSNYYLRAIKQFCRWMVRERRATESRSITCGNSTRRPTGATSAGCSRLTSAAAFCRRPCTARKGSA